MIAQLFNTWYGTVSAIVIGLVALYGIYKGTSDRASDRLIGILKTTVDEMEKKITDLETQQKVLTTDIDNLKTTNKTLVDILQGRDSKTVEMYTMTKTTFENVERLCNLMEKHLEKLEAKQ